MKIYKKDLKKLLLLCARILVILIVFTAGFIRGQVVRISQERYDCIYRQVWSIAESEKTNRDEVWISELRDGKTSLGLEVDADLLDEYIKELEERKKGEASKLSDYRLLSDYIASMSPEEHLSPAEKPVIYVYTDKDNQFVEVNLRRADNNPIDIEYPMRDNGQQSWYIVGNKDGRFNQLHMSFDDTANGLSGNNSHGDERVYEYLYWEDNTDGKLKFDFTKGFCVAGSDTIPFLENALAEIGLTDREANEFITYWLPRMCGNKYNLISFQTDNYTDFYKLSTNPSADNMLRVYMAFKPIETPVEIEPQSFEELKGDFKRDGLCIVEWGGSEVK